MFSVILILAIGFVIGETVGYFLHRLLHASWSGRLHRAHMTHHLKLYPTTDFFSEKYRDPGKDSTVIPFAILFITLAGLFFVFLPLKFAIIVSAEFLILGLFNDYLHDIFHIRPNWLEKKKWFQKLRRIHYRHHVDMSKNYGIFTFTADRVFKTLAK